MFAQDRDLLAYEPNLFRDVDWVGQRILDATGNVSGTTLTITSGGSLVATGVGAGFVALVGGVPVELISVIDASKAQVSLLRAQPDGPAIPPPAATGAPVRIVSFAPQLAIVHAQALRMLGIEPDAAAQEGALTESSIITPGAMRRLECLGALHLIYAGAGALAPAESPLWQRAGHYRERFAGERTRVAVCIDTDGDGAPDAIRRMNVARFIRA